MDENKYEGKRQLGRHRSAWKDHVKRDLKETGCEDVNCTHLTQDRAPYLMLLLSG
jgi:hypothetical protein